MNSKQLINYVQVATGRQLHLTQLSLYIRKEWLRVDNAVFPHRYTLEYANQFVRQLTALTLTEAAKQMTDKLGWTVTTVRIRELCEQDKIIYVGSPYRIPVDDMPILEEQLRLQEGIPEHVAQAIIAQCLNPMTMTELVKLCNEKGYQISFSMLSRIKSNDRKMTAELYDVLLTISQGE